MPNWVSPSWGNTRSPDQSIEWMGLTEFKWSSGEDNVQRLVIQHRKQCVDQFRLVRGRIEVLGRNETGRYCKRDSNRLTDTSTLASNFVSMSVKDSTYYICWNKEILKERKVGRFHDWQERPVEFSDCQWLQVRHRCIHRLFVNCRVRKDEAGWWLSRFPMRLIISLNHVLHSLAYRDESSPSCNVYKLNNESFLHHTQKTVMSDLTLQRLLRD